MFRHFTTAQSADHLTETFWKKTKSLVVIAGRARTFARGGATVVFEVRAVFPLVVLWASAVVVGGQVEAGRSVLTWVGGAVIDIQLSRKGMRKDSGEPDSRHSFCYTKQSETHSILPTGCARKQHMHSNRREGKKQGRDIGAVLRVWASALRNVSRRSQEQLQQSTLF